jgi:hypothetical protein
MKKLTPILFASGLTALIYFTAYLRLDSYYRPFNIDIKQWLELDEWISLNLDASLNLVSKLFIVLGISWLMLNFDKYAFNSYTSIRKDKNLSKKNKSKMKFRFYIVYYTILILFALIMIYFIAIEPNPNLTTRTYDFLLSILPLFLIIVYLIIKRRLNLPVLSSLSYNWVILFISLSVIFFHPIIYAGKENYNLITSDAVTTVKLKGKEIDSLIYLGSTRKVYFVASKEDSTTYILRKDSVISIQMRFPTKSPLLIK